MLIGSVVYAIDYKNRSSDKEDIKKKRQLMQYLFHPMNEKESSTPDKWKAVIEYISVSVDGHNCWSEIFNISFVLYPDINIDPNIKENNVLKVNYVNQYHSFFTDIEAQQQCKHKRENLNNSNN